MADRYEYGIVFASNIRRVGKGKLQERHIHRANMTLPEARHWVGKYIEDGGNTEQFVIVRRPIGEWTTFHTNNTAAALRTL